MQSVIFLFLTTLVSVTLAQQQQYTTPIPILKQINRHNEDGSYSYGYEGADGSFKIETKFANGEVQGKYGYVDDTGKTREIEYGASKRGFEPVGTDINVPPPTLGNNNYPAANGEDDGQYREDPSIYHKDSKYNSKSSVFAPARAYQPQQKQQQVKYNNAPQQQQYYQQNPVPAVRAPAPVYQQPQQQHRFQYQEQPQQQYYEEPQQQRQVYQPQPQQYYQPRPTYKQADQHDIFRGHPAENIDINTGSYSVNYSG